MALNRDGGTLASHGFALRAHRPVDYVVKHGDCFAYVGMDGVVGSGTDWWTRARLRDTKAEHIIRCRFCRLPATHLDHHFYGGKHTTCDEHWARRDEE